jgi:hypothetical protein
MGEIFQAERKENSRNGTIEDKLGVILDGCLQCPGKGKTLSIF